MPGPRLMIILSCSWHTAGARWSFKDRAHHNRSLPTPGRLTRHTTGVLARLKLWPALLIMGCMQGRAFFRWARCTCRRRGAHQARATSGKRRRAARTSKTPGCGCITNCPCRWCVTNYPCRWCASTVPAARKLCVQAEKRPTHARAGSR